VNGAVCVPSAPRFPYEGGIHSSIAYYDAVWVDALWCKHRTVYTDRDSLLGYPSLRACEPAERTTQGPKTGTAPVSQESQS
jgi:hypothetical protein